MPPTIIEVTSPCTRRITEPGGNKRLVGSGHGLLALRSIVEGRADLPHQRSADRRQHDSGRLAAPALLFRRRLQLAAGGIDVAAARRAHRRGDARLEDDVAESA